MLKLFSNLLVSESLSAGSQALHAKIMLSTTLNDYTVPKLWNSVLYWFIICFLLAVCFYQPMRSTLLIVISLLATFAFSSVTQSQSKIKVLVIGDSLSVGSAPDLRKQMPGTSFQFDHRIGRGSAEGLQHLRADINNSQNVVVYAMGTNDDPNQPSALRKNMEAAYKTITNHHSKRCMVIATIHLPGRTKDNKLNATLRGFHHAHSKNVRLADWEVLANKPGIIGGDNLHGTVKGNRARADLIKKAIRHC